MWPFNSNENEEEHIEECDHDWGEEYVDTLTHPNNIRFEAGEPLLYRYTVRQKDCKKCSKNVVLESSEEIVYFEVDRIEKYNK